MVKNNLLVEDINKFKLLMIYDNSKTYSENLFLEQTAYEMHLEKIFADPEKAQEFLFHNSWNNTYLNLNVYSEVEKEAHDLSREIGI